MSFNKILKRAAVDTIVKDGKSIVVSAATETTNWRRTDAIATTAGTALKDSLASYSKPLPEGTKEVCSRYSQL